jgi:type II secretory pathway pseudopilin PulG
LLIVVAIIAIIAAIAVPGLLRARMSGNEVSAIGSLRTINSGQAAYSSSCAFGGYAVSLKDLVKPPAGSNQGFVSPDLYSDAVVKSGYVVSLAKDAAPGVTDVGTAAATCNVSVGTPASSYVATADPVTTNATGTRHFATDSRGAILFSASAAIPNPIPPGTAIVQ